MKLYCYDTGKGKNITAGEIVRFNLEDQFVKHVNNKHFMIKEHGYGIQNEILEQLKEMGIKKVRIIAKNHINISLLEDWLKQPIKNYGHGNQRFLEESNG